MQNFCSIRDAGVTLTLLRLPQRAACAVAGGLDAADVNVVAEGSVVTLDGAVATQAEIERATAVAANVAGVTTVRNHIILG
ncbi:BON domain-containing protein [Rhizobium sp. AC44/96]|uniref:BON domain-containing protein n=1 Tax=Rhizobium sp. AC44/96 TaxID=1841654 RepID=UPI0009F4E465|nr:BON domain-containing protein [Rhizobium sp. AC44/96]